MGVSLGSLSHLGRQGGHPLRRRSRHPRNFSRARGNCRSSGAPRKPSICREIRGLRWRSRHCLRANRNPILRNSLLRGDVHFSGIPEQPLIRQGINGLRQCGRYPLHADQTQIPRLLFLLLNGRFSGFPTATSDLLENQWFPLTLAAGRWLPRKGARVDTSPSKSEAAPLWRPPANGLFGFSDKQSSPI